MGAIETAMLDASYAQVGKSLGMPTHGYLCATDGKVVDAQAGLESGMTALIGALAGINMISGAGMIDFLACHSPEKLTIDAEIIGMAKRLVEGVIVHTDPFATAFYDNINFKADFLKQRLTRDLFPKEQYLPSNIIDRDSMRGWQNNGSLDTFQRAKARANDLVSKYQRPDVALEHEQELVNFVTALAREAGMDKLPELV
jgi:trimethylamine--corrinoid protein Co-methyltransferase